MTDANETHPEAEFRTSSKYVPGAFTSGFNVFSPFIIIPSLVDQEYCISSPPSELLPSNITVDKAQVISCACPASAVGKSAVCITVTSEVDVQPLSVFVTRIVYSPAAFTIASFESSPLKILPSVVDH